MTQSRSLSPTARRFIEDFAVLLAPWGMSSAAGRIYAYLVQAAQPASLDDIAADLDLAKSSASVIARQLERHGLARSRGVPGSKRVLYEATDLFTDLLTAQSALFGQIGLLLRRRGAGVADAAAQARLRRLATLATEVGEAMAEVIGRHAEREPARDGMPAIAGRRGAELPSGTGG